MVSAWCLVPAGALVLLVPVLLNGFPFIFQDTSDYLIFTPRLYRSPFYGLFLFGFHMNRFIWAPAVAQALIGSALIYLLIRVLPVRNRPGTFAGLIVFLGAFTSLPWFAGFLMPDIFTAYLFLAIYLIGFHLERFGRPLQVMLVGFAGLAMVVHLSHLVLGCGAIAAFVLLSRWLRQPWLRTFVRVAVLCIPVTLTVGAYLTYNRVIFKTLAISPVMRDDYARMVEIANEGSRELGFADTGALWRSGYDMPADDFAAETDRLWAQVKPFYENLHCYVRGRLNAKYGDAVQPDHGPIRADLLGNMWSQQWGNIYDVVAPPSGGASSYDLTELLKAADYDATKMVKTGEGFYVSLGLDPLPQTFWERSQITRPRDREVVCHASAWDLDNADDIRIKMCTNVNGDDFYTVHHELGHNYYQRAYKNQPMLFRNGANDGFHEAIGDFVGLSALTPTYLNQIGLLKTTPGAEEDIPFLLKMALDKIALLPFGLMVDRWRWDVFSGETAPSHRWKCFGSSGLRWKVAGNSMPPPWRCLAPMRRSRRSKARSVRRAGVSAARP
ncbi:M2 family metallopeptidase [Methylobacterium organophilum]|nr:M2 family metallopeptidase [Methylobacterium organophilum]